MEQREVDRVRRHLRAFSAMADDPESFAELAGLVAEFEALIAERARAMTTIGNPKPYTWAELAAPLGITRQAAHKRYARHASP
jgi:hypothetical protein